MKPTELRISNLVYYNMQPHCITKEDFSSFCFPDEHFNILRDGFSAIPITEEWLLRLNFIKLTEILYIHAPLKLQVSQGEFLDEGCFFYIFERFPHEIKYIHDLQNVFFALFREEITLKY